MRLPALTCFASIALLSTGAVSSSARPVAGAPLPRHVHLAKSDPSANDTTVAPKAVRLWFSEKVELKVTTVKLASAAGSAVALGRLSRSDTDTDAPVVATISQALVPGGYTVSWSTASKDGHAAKGTIDFVVKAAR